MTFLTLWIGVGAVILGLVTALWLLSLALKDSSIVDIFWGTGFVVAFWAATVLLPGGLPARLLLLGVLVTIWGLRLSLYILYRNWGKDEDFRYAEWRREAGAAWWWRSYFKVFLLQGFLMWVIAAPLIAAQALGPERSLGWVDALGGLVWLVGFIFEAGGDWQLARFKADPDNKGKLLTDGLWGLTRHPNYFGDAAQWWGFYLIAVAAGAWWTFFSPALMTFLLLRVSGVAMLERSMKEAKPGYEEYVKEVPAFLPRWPKQ
jgi:steroid 5-alpha reductase family enzyme